MPASATSSVEYPSSLPESNDINHCASLGLSILGLGTEYPPYHLGPEVLEELAGRYYPSSPALSKVLTINRYTGISTRSSIGDIDHPIANKSTAPSISELSDLFLTEGVALSAAACRKALKESSIPASDITHVVSTTCTNSANPGYDHYVIKALGIPLSVEKVLLHGVGCSGGLAALRTAANLALGAKFMGKKARILVMACEISSVLVRSELDSIHEEQRTRIGVTLFSDCASAVILSNDHEILEETEKDLGFDVDPSGWKVVLTPCVPELTAAAVPRVFTSLLRSIAASPPTSPIDTTATTIKLAAASDFDWALHPGGSTIITGVEQAMDLTPDHLRASYDVYINHGNSSSATIFSVMDALRGMGEGRDDVVACAFGPGIAVEMALLKRVRRQSHEDRTMTMNGVNGVNGHVVDDAVADNDAGSANHGSGVRNGHEYDEHTADDIAIANGHVDEVFFSCQESMNEGNGPAAVDVDDHQVNATGNGRGNGNGNGNGSFGRKDGGDLDVLNGLAPQVD